MRIVQTVRSVRVLRALRGLLTAAGLFAPCFALAGDNGASPGADSPPWDGTTFRRMVDDATGTAFDVPMLGFRLETRHFEKKTPAYRIKDSFTLWGPNSLEVMIDVFDNPDQLELSRFFEEHLAVMHTDKAAVTSGTASARNVPALHVEQPKAPGIYAQPATVFILNGRVFHVTCANEDDERAVKVYLRVIASLDVTKAAP